MFFVFVVVVVLYKCIFVIDICHFSIGNMPEYARNIAEIARKLKVSRNKPNGN